MQNKVAPFAATPDSTYGHGRQSQSSSHQQTGGGGEPGSADEKEPRLVIEHDPASGAIVYRRVDRRTGQVVAEFSRAAVLKMREDADYVAGEVIRTRA
jgi:hypothetical protein